MGERLTRQTKSKLAADSWLSRIIRRKDKRATLAPGNEGGSQLSEFGQSVGVKYSAEANRDGTTCIRVRVGSQEGDGLLRHILGKCIFAFVLSQSLRRCEQQQ